MAEAGGMIQTKCTSRSSEIEAFVESEKFFLCFLPKKTLSKPITKYKQLQYFVALF